MLFRSPDTRNKSTCSPQDPAFHQQYPRSRRSSYARTLLPPQNDLPRLFVVTQQRCAAVATPYDVLQMEHLSPYHVVWKGGPSPTSATTTATTQKRSSLQKKWTVPETHATESARVIWHPTRQTHGEHRRSDRGGEHLRDGGPGQITCARHGCWCGCRRVSRENSGIERGQTKGTTPCLPRRDRCNAHRSIRKPGRPAQPPRPSARYNIKPQNSGRRSPSVRLLQPVVTLRR